MQKLKSLLTLVLLFSFSLLNAQKTLDLIHVEEFKIESKQLNEERVFAVHLPVSYKNSDNTYPVLYLLDGRAHLQHAISATQYLSARRIIPEMIIVAVYNVDRNRDFSPVFDKQIPTSGGADKFQAFLSDELLPTVTKKYNTSGYSVILGHSFGGTFVTYSLLSEPDLFNAYISVSPYLHFADSYLINLCKEKLKGSYNQDKKYYMTVGNEPVYFEPLKNFTSIIKEKNPENFKLKYDKMPDENHATTPYLSLFNGLKFIFSDWVLTQEMLNKGLSELDKHYKTISKKYGVKASVPENIINLLGYNYLRNNDTEKAIEVFKENTVRYSESANVYDSLGEAYETINKFKLAEENYKKAYDIGLKEKNPNTEIYKRNYERVKGKG